MAHNVQAAISQAPAQAAAQQQAPAPGVALRACYDLLRVAILPA
ncbi:hypothetical protein [Entomohabitans teleogrylli]|nr:hypothetical protein [Entomohabitans teleogrylli]